MPFSPPNSRALREHGYDLREHGYDLREHGYALCASTATIYASTAALGGWELTAVECQRERASE
jgi:hypothetical protein